MGIGKDLKGLVFDLDGTLFRLNVDWAGLRTRLESELSIAVCSFNDLLDSAAEPDKNRIAQLLEDAELRGVQTGEVLPGAPEVLQSLSRKYKIAVVSRNGRSPATAVLQRIGISNVVLVAREDVKYLKPHPEGLELALAELELSAHQAAVIGDTFHDVEAARSLRMLCIVVKNDRLQFTPEGDYTIDSLLELQNLLQQLPT